MSFTVKLDNGEKFTINDENFNEYFFDTRLHKPKKGQVLARFTAIAEFVEGKGKQDIIDLLKRDKALAAVQVMQKIHCVKPPYSYKVLKEMAKDLLWAKEEAVEKKPYEMVIEYTFWTEKQYVPKNSNHWNVIQLMEFDKENGIYKSRIEI